MRGDTAFGNGGRTVEVTDPIGGVSPGTVPLEHVADLASAYCAAVERPLDRPPPADQVWPGATVTVAF